MQGGGYPDLKIYKDHSPADRVIFAGISRFCAPLESEDTFYKNPYHAYGQIQHLPVHGNLNPGAG